MITREDMDIIKAELDERYVLQSDCNEKQTKISGRLANDDKRIDLIIQNQANSDKKMTLNNWLTMAILGAIITFVVSYFLKG